MPNTMPQELADIIALHRQMFGGFQMMADDAPAAPDATESNQQPTDEQHTDQPDDKPTEGETTDWKAEARKWEKRAKDNKDAAEKLAQIEDANKSETEKATEQLQALTTERDTLASDLAAARRELAIVRNAGDADPAKLLDSRAFLDGIADIDPGNTEAITKAISDAIAASPWLRRTPASNGDTTRGHTNAGTTPVKPGMARLTAAYADKYQ